MSNLKNIGNAFETKSAHDAEMQFRAEASRNKPLQLQTNELMDKTDDYALNYAREVTKSDFEEAGIKDVYYKVRPLHKSGIPLKV